MFAAASPAAPAPTAVTETQALSPTAPAAMRLGMMGPYDLSQAGAMQAAGVTDLLLEISWPRAEPSQGVFDVTYLQSIRFQAQQLELAGFQVALNPGMMNAPQWLLQLPGAQYVDQYGDAYTDNPIPNLVFGSSLRPIAQQYLNELFAVAGASFSNVRAGGGLMGELSYPYEFDSAGKVRNLYWAYDANASTQNPVPGWRPGSPSPNGEAQTFLSWYLNRLASFQNWQVQALRTAGYRGSITMLYPSYGMRPGDFNKAVGTNLAGTSSPEINGEVQRGYDFDRQITALTDPKVVVYSTWGDNPAPVTYLAGLASAHHLSFMAENGGGNSAAQIDVALKTAAAAGATTFYLVRAPQFFCSCTGYATIAQAAASYHAAIAMAATPASSTGAANGGSPATGPVPPFNAAAGTPAAPVPGRVTAPAVAASTIALAVRGLPVRRASRSWSGVVQESFRGGTPPGGKIQLLLRSGSRTVVAQTFAADLPIGPKRIRVHLPKSGSCWLSVRYLGDAHFSGSVSKALRVRA